MKVLLNSCFLLFLITYSSCQQDANHQTELSYELKKGEVVDQLFDWEENTAITKNVKLMNTENIGGKFDLMGNGGLLLSKKDTVKSFWKSSNFESNGEWISKWYNYNQSDPLLLEVDMIIYGKPQDMTKGWIKFEGNPLVCEHGWKNASGKSLQLPKEYSEWPNDQALVRGRRGKFEGKWLLLFNIGPWAIKGWGMVVADSLSLIKDGKNPFYLVDDYYPLFKGTTINDTVGYNAPNDWIEQHGVWYAPDESRDHKSHMWTSTDLLSWEDKGVIEGINGHDPGMCFDGNDYYLFNEDDHKITYCKSQNPLGPYEPLGEAFDVGGHTGDADVSYFNNAWHMTFDDGPHAHYQIGYATTTAEKFPLGWVQSNQFFGPHLPEQGQQCDDDTEEGNAFGTGDADLALEGTTLYMTYERPVGIAYKELEVSDNYKKHKVRLIVQTDKNDDGEVDEESVPMKIRDGISSIVLTPEQIEGSFRLIFSIETAAESESALIRSFSFK